MTDEELADWNRLNEQARTRLIHSTPCEDCTPEFATEQRALGLCNGFPGDQRFCLRCLRWWPDDNQHWASMLRRRCCLACRQKNTTAKFYRRLRADPERWAARKEQQRVRARARYRTDPEYRVKVLANYQRRYRNDPVFRESVLVKHRKTPTPRGEPLQAEKAAKRSAP
jgi:hypothetical protein